MTALLLYMVQTGDFPGWAVAGVQEDSPVVLVALWLHALFV